mmetsp:Transcript_2462/g.6518  ORF Transcript_2462/g.6518 Transcript_2462/m.6518 type:complete len:582 (-) Transcript_2462:590-2335(-)
MFFSAGRPSPSSLVGELASLKENPATFSLLSQHGLEVAQPSASSIFGAHQASITLSVEGTDMPIIRCSQAASLEVPAPSLAILTGNENGRYPLSKKHIDEFLQSFGDYQSRQLVSDNWKGSLSATSRGEVANVHVAGQACFLPVAETSPLFGGHDAVPFRITYFNSKSHPSSPAAMVVVASAFGASSQAPTSRRQHLFHNSDGKRCPFLVERTSASRMREGQHQQQQEEAAPAALSAQEEAKNCLLVIEVPLKTTPQPLFGTPHALLASGGGIFGSPAITQPGTAAGAIPTQQFGGGGFGGGGGLFGSSSGQVGGGLFGSSGAAEPPSASASAGAPTGTQEAAVISLGEEGGLWPYDPSIKIERDQVAPLKVTILFYYGASSSYLDSSTVQRVKAQLEAARAQDFLTQLVQQWEALGYDGAPRGAPTAGSKVGGVQLSPQEAEEMRMRQRDEPLFTAAVRRDIYRVLSDKSRAAAGVTAKAPRDRLTQEEATASADDSPLATILAVKKGMYTCDHQRPSYAIPSFPPLRPYVRWSRVLLHEAAQAGHPAGGLRAGLVDGAGGGHLVYRQGLHRGHSADQGV